MSWIDKIFKQHLKERSFSSELKQNSWDKLERSFGTELGDISSEEASSSNLRFYLGIIVGILLVSIPASVWLFSPEKDGQPALLHLPAEEKTRRPTDKIESVRPLPLEKNTSNEGKTNGNESDHNKISTATSNIEDKEEVSFQYKEVYPEQPTEKESYNLQLQEVNTIGDEIATSGASDGELNTKESLEAEEGGEIAIVTEPSTVVSKPKIKASEPLNDTKLADATPETNEDPVTTEKTATEENQTLIAAPAPLTVEDPGESSDEVETVNTTANTVTAEKQEEIAQYQREEEVTEEESEQEIPNNSFATADQHFAFAVKDEHNPDLFRDLSLLSGKRFSITLWGGYSQVQKQLQADDKAYLALRQNEQPLNTTPTGLDLDYYITPNFTFGTGINWAEYGEEVNYDWTNTVITPFQVRDTAFVDGRYGNPRSFPGLISIDSTRIIDSINVGHWNYEVIYELTQNDTSQESERLKATNSWQYVEIPLTLGYRFGKGFVRPWLKTGISIGLPIRVSYNYPLQSGDQFNLGETEDQAPILYHYLLSIGVDIYITRNWSLRLSGFGSRQINSAIEQQGIRQRYERLGAIFGLTYNF